MNFEVWDLTAGICVARRATLLDAINHIHSSYDRPEDFAVWDRKMSVWAYGDKIGFWGREGHVEGEN